MPTIASTTKQRQLAGGKLFFDLFNAAGQKTGERYLGATPGFTVAIKSDKIQSYAAENGIRELDDETITSITRTGKITVRQISLENLALFFAAQSSVQAQLAGAVTGEDVWVLPDRFYQLGATVANPSGVRNVTSVTVTASAAIAAWQSSHAYALGAHVKPAATPLYAYQAITAGTSGASAPTWPTTVGDVVTDGGVSWVCIGILAPVLDTDYTVDTARARVYTLPGARVSSQYPMPWALGYTKTAASRDQLKTGGLTSNSGALRFEAHNIKGNNRDLYGANVLLAPSGDIVFKDDSPKYGELSFEISFSDGLNGEPALIIDGQAV